MKPSAKYTGSELRRRNTASTMNGGASTLWETSKRLRLRGSSATSARGWSRSSVGVRAVEIVPTVQNAINRPISSGNTQRGASGCSSLTRLRSSELLVVVNGPPLLRRESHRDCARLVLHRGIGVHVPELVAQVAASEIASPRRLDA